MRWHYDFRNQIIETWKINNVLPVICGFSWVCVQLMKRRGDRKLITRWKKNHIYHGRFFYYRFPIWCGKIHCDASSQVKFLIRASSHTYRFVGNRADRAKMIVTLAHWYTRSKLGYTRVIYIHCTLLQTGDEFLSWVYHTLVNSYFSQLCAVMRVLFCSVVFICQMWTAECK